MLETAKKAALAAGKIHMDSYGKILNVDAKLKDDIKLEVDKLSEKAVIDIILKAYPDHSILGEEGGSIDNNSEYLWIIDPLDGTVNYFYGIPYFCTSIACFKSDLNRTEQAKSFKDLGEPVCAAIYAGPRDELIYAENGGGAYLNGEQIFASTETNLKESILTTGFGHTKDSFDMVFSGGAEIASKIRKMRCMGAAAYDMANVACGRFTGFFEGAIKTWDLAAGAFIAQEAGAEISAFETADRNWDTIVAAPGIIEELKKTVRKV